MIKVLVKKLKPSVKLPSYKTNGASGMDLMACIDKSIDLKPGQVTELKSDQNVGPIKRYPSQMVSNFAH